VSTEDAEIAAVAKRHGAPVLERPRDLAGDAVQNNAVLRHAIETEGAGFGWIALLQPTSPLRRAEDIDACLRPLLSGEARSAMTITPETHHPGKSVRLDDGLVEPLTTERDMEARRQDLPPAYRQNGAVYALGIADFLRYDKLYMRPCRGIVMPVEASVDIDSEMDLVLAEYLFGALRERKESQRA
jgi:CMP-N-acetylneuraminic acid synthetase